MPNLLLHPTTNHQYQALLQALPHAILMTGSEGSGKQTMAKEFAMQALHAKDLENTPYFLHISPEKNTIGVETIRQIKDFLSRKTTGSAQIRRIILITDGHTMTTEAQNALLKTLEEPPEDTVVIVTADELTGLRPTIRSRAQQLSVLPVGYEAVESYFIERGYEKEAIQLAYYMSEGRVGLLNALLDQSTEHQLVGAINQAKDVLKMSTYERLTQVDALSKQKEQLALLMQGLGRVVISGLRQAAQKKNEATVKKFYSLSTAIQRAEESLSVSGNAKIVLTDLFLQM